LAVAEAAQRFGVRQTAGSEGIGVPPAAKGVFVVDIVVELGSASVAYELVDPICDLYDEVFSAPPFHWELEESANHRARLLRLLADPSFGVALARAGARLVGFAYGYALRPGGRWWSGFSEPLPAGLAQEWEGRTFVLFDFAVAAPCRGRGVGRRLLDTLLGSRREERATLAVQPAAVQTQAVYRHLGWQKVGRVEAGPDSAAPFFDIYVLPLDRP